ncbi:MAG TPA: FixH family protein [Chitinophaga sp.]|uniref:FixH family protein n=1 Tax=Chitinophaga sp. TaxID=1869181 RepID=UPI002D10D937|nr:FixH family protein [Chitinophaga sp.]HVI48009.1 FixH family protein [Chitinophaga sp.]
MNWGYKIIIVFVLFAAGILSLVFKSMRTKIDMVTPDYYGEELKYQQVIDGRHNLAALSVPVLISQSDNSVVVTFPKEIRGHRISGSIKFYCAADSRKDLLLPVKPDENGQQQIARSMLFKGQYEVKVKWETEGKPYYQEQGLDID